MALRDWLFDVDPTTVRRFLPGDLFAVALFVVAGELEHGVPVDDPAVVADTAVPFYVGWLVAAPALGAYGRRARASLPAVVLGTLPAALAASGLAMGLRATASFGGDADAALFLVAAGVVGALAATWRLATLLR